MLRNQGPVAELYLELLSKHAEPVEMSRAEAEHVVRVQNRAPVAIVVPGPPFSTDQPYLAGPAWVFPPGSVARPSNSCAPSARPRTIMTWALLRRS